MVVDLSEVLDAIPDTTLAVLATLFDRMPAVHEVFTSEMDAVLLSRTDCPDNRGGVYKHRIANFLGIRGNDIDAVPGSRHSGAYTGTAIRLWCEEHRVNTANKFAAWIYVLSAIHAAPPDLVITPVLTAVFYANTDYTDGYDVAEQVSAIGVARKALIANKVAPYTPDG